jgi:hypothetical protein
MATPCDDKGSQAARIESRSCRTRSAMRVPDAPSVKERANLDRLPIAKRH